MHFIRGQFSYIMYAGTGEGELPPTSPDTTNLTLPGCGRYTLLQTADTYPLTPPSAYFCLGAASPGVRVHDTTLSRNIGPCGCSYQHPNGRFHDTTLSGNIRDIRIVWIFIYHSNTQTVAFSMILLCPEILGSFGYFLTFPDIIRVILLHAAAEVFPPPGNLRFKRTYPSGTSPYWS